MNRLTAESASLWALIVRKPYFFDRPLLPSFMILSEVTSPTCENNVINSASVVEFDKLPTYNMTSIPDTPIPDLMKEKEGRQPITGMAAEAPH